MRWGWLAVVCACGSTTRALVHSLAALPADVRRVGVTLKLP